MTIATGERRRSDRIWLTIPLRAEVVDPSGRMVEHPGRAVNLSRHGGRIEMPQMIDRGQPIRLRSPLGRHLAEFRVVEAIPGYGENGCECGVECLNEEDNFWGIEFPSHVDDAVDAKVLLECGMCRTIALKPLSLAETQTLIANDNLTRHCAKCAGATLWWYAEIRVPWNRQPERQQSSIVRQARWITAITEFVERSHRRVHMQMALWIRGRYGDSDSVRTENVSKLGFSFSSEEKHFRGEIVTAAFPVASMTQQTPMPARIVHEQVLGGSTSRIYGARFEPQTRSKPLSLDENPPDQSATTP